MTSYLPRSKNAPTFLRNSEIEEEAALLLAQFGEQHVYITSPPIPVDEIVEEHLKLVIEYRDLRAEFPEGDVLGAIWFQNRVIAIDQSLVPEDNPAMRGRYRFTLAHEIGHWQLHRKLYAALKNEQLLWSGGSDQPDHVLRSDLSDPKEVQANRFAACLLMPRELVKCEWKREFGGLDPLFLQELRANRSDNAPDEVILDKAARPLATAFEVSATAMRIRLEGLGLLLRKKEKLLF